MARYAVLIFEKVPPEELPPEVMRGHSELPDRIAERGGRVVAGLGLEPEATATAIRGDVLTDGPFIETKEALGGFYVIEARARDHARQLAQKGPEGDVEVPPRLPTTGELVPLLQIAPSKSDEERLLLVGPELADVLSAIVQLVLP